MSFLDNFLNKISMNDDDDYDDDGYFYDDDDESEFEEERRPKRKLFQKVEDEEDDINTEEEAPVKKAKPERPQRTVTRSNKVTPMRAAQRKSNEAPALCVIKPTSMEDTREITETLLSNQVVVLNLEGMDVDVAQRIIDFASGSCYAIAGKLQKVSNYIFIITPPSVDITGDIPEIVNGAVDLPSIYSGF